MCDGGGGSFEVPVLCCVAGQRWKVSREVFFLIFVDVAIVNAEHGAGLRVPVSQYSVGDLTCSSEPSEPWGIWFSLGLV